MAKRKTPPSFDFYPDDFIGGTADFSPLAMGCYIRCLCYQWSHGFVPSDRQKLLRITGALEGEFDEVFDDLMSKFREVGPGQLQNDRMQSERTKALDLIKRRSAAGKAGANARHSNRKANAEQSQQNRNGKTLRQGRGKGEEGRTRKEKGKATVAEIAAVALPSALDTPEFRAAWADWLAYKQDSGKPYKTVRGAQSQLSRIAKWGPQRAIAAIEYSISQEYQGIYEESSGGGRNPSDPRGNLSLLED